MQATTGTALTESSAADSRASGRAALTLWAAVAVAVYTLDQATKWWAESTLSNGIPRPLLGDWLQAHLAHNAGAAFSLGTSYTIGLSLVALVVVIACLRISRRLRSLGWATAIGLLLAGALGNLTDRLFRAPGPFRGHVIDFLQLPNWPVFNVADAAICLAAVLFVVLTVRGVHLDGRVDRRSVRATDAPLQS